MNRWLPRRLAFKVLGEGRYEWLRARHLARQISSGSYDLPELGLLRHLVRDGETAVDVGANYGVFSFRLAQLVGESGKVVAFEAAPRTALALTRILSVLGADGRVQIVIKGVGERPGMFRLAVPRRADGSTESGLAWVVPPDEEPSAVEIADVEIVTLDDELAATGEISFIKVDVEGADLQALLGAERIIARDAPTILVEISRPLLARQGVRPEDVAAFFDRHGYATYAWDDETGLLRPASPSTVDGDIVAVHPRRAARVEALAHAAVD